MSEKGYYENVTNFLSSLFIAFVLMQQKLLVFKI